MSILIFSDQTASQRAVLEYATHQKPNALLSTFLDQSAIALREEIASLPRPERDAIPTFLSISDLVRLYYDESPPPDDGHHGPEKGSQGKQPLIDRHNPAIESCFLTLGQLSHYLGYFGDHPSRYSLPSPTTRNIGICTGALASIAVASARSLTELVPLAVQMVRVAFRVGILVSRARDTVTPASADCFNGSGSDLSGSWSSIVAGVGHEEAVQSLDQFHGHHSIPVMNRAYVSAVSAGTVTVSGPPATLARIWSAADAGDQTVSSFSGRARVRIPVYGPYHAPHLYSSKAQTDALGPSSEAVMRQFRPLASVHSAVTGQLLKGDDTFEMTKMALDEMLCQQVRLDLLLQAVSDQPKVKEFHVISVGANNLISSLTASLRSKGDVKLSSDDIRTWMSSPTMGSARTQDDKIAIVGMSGRFPNASSVDALWELLEKGVDAHREVPSDRFDAQAHTDPSGKGKNKSHTPYGCFIDEPGLFDPRFFNMSPREAAQTDPMARLALTTAYEALEMSGYVPNRTPSTRLDRIGTFYGQTSDDWREINAAEQIDTYFITGGVRAFAPGRINYFFKFSGPSYSIDTACSSSLAAIQVACTALWAGDCDTACAGGLNVLTNPDIFSGLSKGQFLSRTGGCKTFDGTADGYCRGDACASVVLKRYRDAVADKDNILGCILAAGTNHSAEAISITHPHAGAQAFLYKSILGSAGVDVHDVEYVEMHGTGTQAGDGIEMESVTSVFAPRNRQRKDDNPLYLGAIKANVGHAEAASGVNSVVKVLKMFEKELIPPNVGIKTALNTEFPDDLLKRNVHIPVQSTPFRRHNDGTPRRVFLNNFSAAGGNTAILLEEGPTECRKGDDTDPRDMHLVAVSARSMAALRNNIQRLAAWIESNPEVPLSDVAYTSAARRIQHNFRVSVTGNDRSKIATALLGEIKDTYKPVTGAPRVAFTFTGQGSHYVGTGKELYKSLPLFRSSVDDLQRIAIDMGFPGFLPMIEGDDAGFSQMNPVAIQLGLTCLQVSLARVWRDWGVVPDVVVGHSLGEYAALQVAGVISASEMVYLVGKRAQLLVEKCTEGSHSMLAIRAGIADIQFVLDAQSGIEIACVNGPSETVLGGLSEDIGKAAEMLNQKGIKATSLRVPFAFHSAQVVPIIDEFIAAGRGVTFRSPQIPVLSPLTGDVVAVGDNTVFGSEYLAKHARQKVDFDAAVSSGVATGLVDEKTAWIEIGAHAVTGPMVKSILNQKLGSKATATELEILTSLRRGKSSWEVLTQTVSSLYRAGTAVDFEEFHRPFDAHHNLAALPTYAFDNKRYWLEYHNNWCLTKGEDLVNTTASGDTKTESAPAIKAPKPIYSTSCQFVIDEEINTAKRTARVVFESNLADERLRRVTSGHVINGVPLCPSSLNADMAMTAAGYLWKKMKAQTTPDLNKKDVGAGMAGSSGISDIDIGLNVCNVEVHTPMIPDSDLLDNGQFLIEIEANANFARGEVEVIFRSKTSPTPDGEVVTKEHGRGKVLYEDRNAWLTEWKRMSHMVRGQVQSVCKKGRDGQAHTLQRGLAYRLFGILCEYGDRFRGMSEVIVDADLANSSGQGVAEPEAVARVQFRDSPADGTFFCSPYWIDSVCHLSGFVVNSGVANDSSSNSGVGERAFISHGWGSIKVARQLSRDREYTAYVKMQPEDKMMVGDVYFLDGDEVIAVTTGLKFQGIPRKALDIMLPKKKTAPASAKIPASSWAAPASAKAPASSWAKPAPVARPTRFTPPVPAAAPISIVSRVMTIIQAETDVPAAELIDDATFDSLGLDSLMGLTIAAKFREDLDIDVPSSVFLETGSIGPLKAWISQHYPDPVSSSSESVSTDLMTMSKPSSGPSSEGYASDSTELTAPSPEPSIWGAKSARRPAYSPVQFAPEPAIIPSLSSSSSSETVALARQVIATEMGIDESELAADLVLSDIGMDSLMSLTVLGELRDKIGIDLPPDFLLVNPTMGAVERALGPEEKPEPVAPVVSIPPPAAVTTPPASPDAGNFSASSVLLQGSAKAPTKIFLIPDGSGSATSYATLPRIGSDIAAFGLNCPFLKSPEKWTSGIPGLASLYISEMRRRQPVGPYFLAGWSAGGIIAYEMVVQLTRVGQTVEKLILIDSPCPINLEPLPERLHEFFDRIGFLGSGPGRAPDWLVPHFQASVRALSDYDPVKLTSLPNVQMPTITAIWATDGVCGAKSKWDAAKVLTGQDPAPMRWLLNDRTDFSDNGWGALLGGSDNMSFVTVPGHHFEILKDEGADKIAGVLRRELV